MESDHRELFSKTLTVVLKSMQITLGEYAQAILESIAWPSTNLNIPAQYVWVEVRDVEHLSGADQSSSSILSRC